MLRQKSRSLREVNKVNYSEDYSEEYSPLSSRKQWKEGKKEGAGVTLPPHFDRTNDLLTTPEWALALEKRIAIAHEKRMEKMEKSFENSLSEMKEEIKKEIKKEMTNSIQVSINKLGEDLRLELKSNITELEVKLTKEQDDLNEKLSNVEENMETCINHGLEAQQNKINMLINTEVERQVRPIKKAQAENLSCNILLSGTKIPEVGTGENLKKIAYGLIKNYACEQINENEIESVERFGRKPDSGVMDRRAICLKFTSKETKENVVKGSVRRRTVGFYVNEKLTPEVNELYREMRKLKKDYPSYVAILHTNEGVIKVRKTRTGKMFDILTRSDLENFKKTIELPIE